MFVELHAKSAFSFLEAAALPEALAERAAALGQPALALVDTEAGQEEVSVALVDAVAGDTILVHAGEAIAVVPA